MIFELIEDVVGPYYRKPLFPDWRIRASLATYVV